MVGDAHDFMLSCSDCLRYEFVMPWKTKINVTGALHHGLLSGESIIERYFDPRMTGKIFTVTRQIVFHGEDG